MLELKNVMGLVASVLGLFICLIYRNTIVFEKTQNKINEKLFDTMLVTLGDYSIQAEVS